MNNKKVARLRKKALRKALAQAEDFKSYQGQTILELREDFGGGWLSRYSHPTISPYDSLLKPRIVNWRQCLKIGQGLDWQDVAIFLPVAFRRKGPRYVALCPFHEEKNPSFQLLPDFTTHCYGCGETWHGVELVAWHMGLRTVRDIRLFFDQLRDLKIDKQYIQNAPT